MTLCGSFARAQALRLAITAKLFPVLRKEVEAQLLQEAREWVAAQMQDALWSKVSMAPWRTKVKKKTEALILGKSAQTP